MPHFVEVQDLVYAQCVHYHVSLPLHTCHVNVIHDPWVSDTF